MWTILADPLLFLFIYIGEVVTMKIAVSSTGPDLDSQVDPRFGRCKYFLIVDSDTMEFEAVENANAALGGGAGIQSAQLVADKGATAVLTGNCGPNAFRTLEAANVTVITGMDGSVRDAIEKFKNGGTTDSSGPNVGSHAGMK